MGGQPAVLDGDVAGAVDGPVGVLQVPQHRRQLRPGQGPHPPVHRIGQPPPGGVDFAVDQPQPAVQAGGLPAGVGPELLVHVPPHHQVVALHERRRGQLPEQGGVVRLQVLRGVGVELVLQPHLVQRRVRGDHPGHHLDAGDQFLAGAPAGHQLPERVPGPGRRTRRRAGPGSGRPPRTPPTGTGCHRSRRGRPPPGGRAGIPASTGRPPRRASPGRCSIPAAPPGAPPATPPPWA